MHSSSIRATSSKCVIFYLKYRRLPKLHLQWPNVLSKRLESLYAMSSGFNRNLPKLYVSRWESRLWSEMGPLLRLPWKINRFLTFYFINRSFFILISSKFILQFSGRHPNCKCTNRDHVYDPSLRYCDLQCDDGVNVSPFCTCKTYYKHFHVRKTAKCRPYAYPDRPCPPFAIGKSPNCHCLQDGHVFIDYAWGCFKEYSVKGFTVSCSEANCNNLLTLSEIEPRRLIRVFG